MKSHRLKTAVLSCLLALVAGYSTAYATTFNVNTFNDTIDFTCDDIDCSLRDAIFAANSNPGLDTIVLPQGTFALSLTGPGEDSTEYGDLDISDDLNITGAGPALTSINGNRVDRVFHIAPEGQDIFVSMFGLSIQGGKTLDVTTTAEEAAGGGILNKGDLSLTNVHIKGNEAAVTGTGGALHNLGKTTIFRGEISNNSAAQGGGIYNEGSMEVLASTVNANTTNSVNFDNSGGGIFNQGELFVLDTTIFDNTASGLDGGGIYNNKSINLINSTIDNNTVNTGGGGGIYNAHETALSNVTITNNEAPDSLGGGILNDGTIDIGNSLLANNTAMNTVANCNYPGDGIITQGYNLEDSDSCNLRGPGDLINTAPLLLARAFNGGFTPTLGLQPASPAVDSGNPTGCSDIVDERPLTTDQRALPRPVDGDGDFEETCDIGAFEYNSTRPAGADLAVRIDAVVEPLSVGDTATYQTTFFNLGADTATNTQVTIELPETFDVSSVHTSQGSCDLVLEPGLPLKNINCSLGTTPEGTTGTIIFSGQPGSGVEATMTASITSDQPDNVPDNNSSSTVLFEDRLMLKSPNGGQLLQSGSTHRIIWVAPDEATRFKLRYSLDNGASWTRIAVVKNATKYKWNVPDVKEVQPNSLVNIIAFDTDRNNLGNDLSDENFTIAPDKLAIITPNGGEVLQSGSTHVIKWTAPAEATRFKLKYTTNNGANWTRIGVSRDSTNYKWSVPEVTRTQTNSRVKVIAFDANRKKLGVDLSDENFTIAP